VAPSKTTTAPEYDFDNWTEEDEEKALAAAVPDVKHIIVERRFVGRFENGDVVEVPLTLSLDAVDELQSGGQSPVDQFKSLLTTVGGEDVAKQFASHDLVEAAIMAEKFFRTLQRVQQAAFPES
jgi:hypothetical protein